MIIQIDILELSKSFYVIVKKQLSISILLTCFLTPGNITRNAMYKVPNSTLTATMSTSPVTGVRLENE